jgi:hypothetical protein
VWDGRVLPPHAARGPREPATTAQLRHLPAQRGAGPRGCRGNARAAGGPQRCRPTQPYGHIIWEARHEKERVEGYLERAVQAVPDDWYVPAIVSVRRLIRLHLLIDMLV